MGDSAFNIEKEKLNFEREKWSADYELRRQEIELKQAESNRSRWVNPLVIAILAAALAGVGNMLAVLINSQEQSKLEENKASADETLSARQVEAARILEMIKTNSDPDKAAINLKFLVDVGLISSKSDARPHIEAYLKNRKPGEGPSLPSSVPVSLPTETGNAASLASTCNYFPPKQDAPDYKENSQYSLFVFYRTSRTTDCQTLMKGLAAAGYQATPIATTFEESGQYADNGVALVQPSTTEKSKKILDKVENVAKAVLPKVQAGDPYPLRRGDIQVYLY